MPFSKSQQKKLTALGKRVKELRKEKNMTQKALALAIDKDPQSIQRLETGGVNPGYLYLLQIAEGLQIPLSELLQDLSE